MSQRKGIEKANLVKNIAKKECEQLCESNKSIDDAVDYLRDLCDILTAIEQHRKFDSREERRYVKDLENVLVQFMTEYFSHIVDNFIEEIIQSLLTGFRVVIYNFMTLELGERKTLERSSFDGTKTIVYPAVKNIKCTFSNVLKKRINEEK